MVGLYRAVDFLLRKIGGFRSQAFLEERLAEEKKAKGVKPALLKQLEAELETFRETEKRSAAQKAGQS